VARTDAIAVEGFEPAIERAHRYREAGADMTSSRRRRRLSRSPPRQAAVAADRHIVARGRTPELPNQKLKQLGFAGVLYANLALPGVGARDAACARRAAQERTGRRRQRAGGRLLRAQRLVGKDAFDALEQKYKV